MFAGIADKDWSTHVPEVAAAHCPHLLHMTWIIQRDQQVFPVAGCVQSQQSVVHNMSWE